MRVPMAVANEQFIITNDLGEILTVGVFIRSSNSITWKFGEPKTQLKDELEKAITDKISAH
jgi:hypothetical protein